MHTNPKIQLRWKMFSGDNADGCKLFRKRPEKIDSRALYLARGCVHTSYVVCSNINIWSKSLIVTL